MWVVNLCMWRVASLAGCVLHNYVLHAQYHHILHTYQEIGKEHNPMDPPPQKCRVQKLVASAACSCRFTPGKGVMIWFHFLALLLVDCRTEI